MTGTSPLIGTGPLRDRVYLTLRQDLMAGALDPAERLGEERLAELYGVSRTPVREALARLLSDGLLRRDDRGLLPYRPRLAEIADLYELRITLELRGIDRVTGDEDSVPRHDRAALAEIVESWRRLRHDPPDPDAGFVSRDEEFHVGILLSSGNAALADALRTVNARIRPVRMFDYLTPDRMRATVDEHVLIGEQLLDGALSDARTTLLDHIDQSRAVVVDRATTALSMAHLVHAVRH